MPETPDTNGQIDQKCTMSPSERLQLVTDTFEAIDVMVAVLDQNMNFLSVNRAFASRRGEQPAYFIGKNYFALYPDAEKQASFLSVARTGKVVRHWKNVVPEETDNETGLRYWDWCLSPVRDHRGRVASLVLSVVDGPQWMKAGVTPETSTAGSQTSNQVVEQSLVQRADSSVSNSAFTRAVLDTISAIVIVVDPQGRILLFNRAWEQLTGYRAEEAIGRPFWDFLRLPEERESAKTAFDDLCSGAAPIAHENHWLTKDGNRRWLAFTNTVLRDARGDVDCIVATGVDMTERKQAEQERLQRERIQRDALVREVHHRIKNTLQGVVGLLRLHSDAHPELAEVFQKAVAQVGTVALVHGLQGKEGTERVVLCDMCEAIAVNLMAPHGDAARVQVNRHSPVPFLVGAREAVPLALVMNELMFNALKHSTAVENAEIQVDIEADAGGVLVRLRNTGAQLPEGLDVMAGGGLGTGLGLVRTLLPKGASVMLRERDGWIETELRVSASAVQLLRTESQIV